MLKVLLKAPKPGDFRTDMTNSCHYSSVEKKPHFAVCATITETSRKSRRDDRVEYLKIFSLSSASKKD